MVHNILGRALKFSSENDINLAKYIFDSAYNRKIPVGVNGLVDTARYLLSDYNCIISSICKTSCQHFNVFKELFLVVAIKYLAYHI